MSNPRNRNQVATTPTATTRANKPSLIRPQTGNTGLDRWISSVSEHLELDQGARNRPLEQTLTKRDLLDLGVVMFGGSGRKPSSGSGVLVVGDNGVTDPMSIDQFALSIFNTKLFRDLTASVNDPHRFDDFPEQTRQALASDIAAEAAKRGAAIRRLDTVVQDQGNSFAQSVTELTAAVQGAAAGVREVMFASASQNRATAGIVTQVQARLDDFNGGGATVEVVMTATADRTAGLAAEYMVKVSAGHAVAGFGLAASEDPSGATSSSFIIEADKFAITSAYNFAQSATPTATVIGQTWYDTATAVSYRATATGTGSWVSFTPKIPFGVDTTADTIYIDGQVRINAGGTRLDQLGLGVVISAPTQVFKQDTTGTWDRSSILLTATQNGGLSGSVVWSIVSGTYTGSLTDVSGTLTITRTNQTTDTLVVKATVTSTNTYTDQISIVKLVDGTTGVNAVSGFLTNETVSVPASSAGVVSSFAGATGAFKVFSGTTDVTASCVFTVQSNPDTVTISFSGSTYTASAAGSWANASNTTSITLRANYTVFGTTVLIDKVFTITKSLAGSAGSAGSRGSQTGYGSNYGITASSWPNADPWAGATSDNLANRVISNMVNGAALTTGLNSVAGLVIGDTVTLSNGTTFAKTKFWSGTGWIDPGVVIDGNLLVSGTVAASKISTTTLSAIVANLGTVTAGSIHGTSDIDITGQAKFGGARTVGSISIFAATANEAGGSSSGFYGLTNVSGGYGLYGQDTYSGTTGAGTFGDSVNGAAVQGVASGASGIGVRASNNAAGKAFYADVGTLAVANSTLVSNLNADLWDGLRAGAIATGASTGTFNSTTKPGSTTTNSWMALTDTGSGITYYLPIWQ